MLLVPAQAAGAAAAAAAVLDCAMLSQPIASARHLAAQRTGKSRMVVEVLGLNMAEYVRLHLVRGGAERTPRST